MAGGFKQIKTLAPALCITAVLLCTGASPIFGQEPAALNTDTRIFDGRNATLAEGLTVLFEGNQVANTAEDIKGLAFHQSSSDLAADEKTGFPSHPLPNYKPITGKQRFNWLVVSTLGSSSLLMSGPVSAAWGTMLNSPEEYGPHWDGFGARYGMRLTGVSTGNATEAALGAIWKEDPRYFRSQNRAFGARVKHVIVTTFMAPRADGRFRPAYARSAGNIGNNFLSNTWRASSENDAGDAAIRCLWGVLGRMAGDALKEFWPDVQKAAFGK